MSKDLLQEYYRPWSRNLYCTPHSMFFRNKSSPQCPRIDIALRSDLNSWVFIFFKSCFNKILENCNNNVLSFCVFFSLLALWCWLVFEIKSYFKIKKFTSPPLVCIFRILVIFLGTEQCCACLFYGGNVYLNHTNICCVHHDIAVAATW